MILLSPPQGGRRLRANLVARACALFGPLALLIAMATDVPAAGRTSDAARGEALYESRCTGCHSLDSNRVGPRHRGVFGRRVGGVADYPYSKALANSELVWDDDTLERWLSDPQGFLPGQRMNIRVRQARDRADIIAFLKRESRESGN